MADPTEQQNLAYINSGAADDDNPTIQRFDDGSSIQIFDDGSTLVTDATGNLSSTIPDNVITNAGTTVAAKTGKSGSLKKPGKRPKNPLGDFSSYTYQITLYMVTPDVYNQFVSSGRTNMSALLGNPASGVYIVAQNGGVNNTQSKRAPGFDYDYYIDNLVIESSAGGKDTGGAFNVTDISFTIQEPYSFSFIKNLKTAMDSIQKDSKLKNMDKMPNAARNFFMLGVRFLGYDAAGNTFVGNSNQTNLNSTKTSTENNGLLERYYDIILSEVNFKIDGKMTTYSCKAKNVGTQAGYGIKFGRLRNDVTAVASTVREALIGNDEIVSGLLSQMNQQQEDMKNAGKIEIANKYNVVFLGDKGEVIANSSVFNKKADPDKTKYPSAPVKTSTDVSAATAVKATPNSNYRNLVFKADTSILQCIQLIISQSSYVEDALKQLYTTEVEPDSKTDSPDEVVNDSNRTLTYYNVSSNIEVLGYDTLLKDFAYSITYVIEPYQIPYLQAVGSNLTIPYYGPAKRYDYWFTGENKEILRYEQSFDNLYFLVAVGGVKDDNVATGGDAATPVTPDLRQNSPRQGKIGIGAEAQNAIANFLTDPKSQAEAKISILGDPDFLMYPNSDRYNPNYDPFYSSDGYTINPNGGQIFIEIDFKEATDYNNTTGVMEVNDKIMFYDYPASMKDKVKGVVYLVTKVKSEFKSGKFEQTLDLKMPLFGTKKGEDSGQRETTLTPKGVRTTDTQGASNQTNPGGSESTGLAQDDATGVDEAVAYQRALNEADQADAYYNGSQTTSGTKFGINAPVADDDSWSAYASAVIVSEGREEA